MRVDKLLFFSFFSYSFVILLVISVGIPSYVSAQTFYSLTRFFADVRKDNSFEDLFELRQRFFLEATYEPSETISLLISGRADINYFSGGFSRMNYLFRIHEVYFNFMSGDSIFSFGRKVVSWGVVDGSPLDVVNRPDFTEGLFSEPRFSKVPAILFEFTHSFGESTIDIIYEPFFTPPDINDMAGDWAILNWRSLFRAFDGDRDNDQLKNLLSGQFSPVVRDYPDELTELLLSFGLGGYLSSAFDTLSLSFVAYTGFEIFPVPVFDSVFLADLQRFPEGLRQIDISAAEIVEPLSRGESFVKLVPRRYYVVGGGWSYDLSGYLLKNDIAFYLLADIPDENLKVREFNLFSFAFDVEREIIPNFILIPGVRGIINLGDISPFIIGDGVISPSFSARYEVYIGVQSISFLVSAISDVPLDTFPDNPKIRSWFLLPSITWKPQDKIELSAGGIFLGGDEISLFGIFRENSAFMFSFRYIL